MRKQKQCQLTAAAHDDAQDAISPLQKHKTSLFIHRDT